MSCLQWPFCLIFHAPLTRHPANQAAMRKDTVKRHHHQIRSPSAASVSKQSYDRAVDRLLFSTAFDSLSWTCTKHSILTSCYDRILSSLYLALELPSFHSLSSYSVGQPFLSINTIQHPHCQQGQDTHLSLSCTKGSWHPFSIPRWRHIPEFIFPFMWDLFLAWYLFFFFHFTNTFLYPLKKLCFHFSNFSFPHFFLHFFLAHIFLASQFLIFLARCFLFF